MLVVYAILFCLNTSMWIQGPIHLPKNATSH